MNVSASIAVRDDFVYPAPDPDDDTPQQAANRIVLGRVADIRVVPRKYKKENDGRSWTLQQFVFSATDDVEGIIAALRSNNPGRTKTLGAWDFDSKPFGTSWVDENDHSKGTTGNPIYPQYGNLLSYMPDIWNGDDPPTFTPATELTDVNVMQGQKDRDFG